MSGSYIVRLIFPTILDGEDSPEILSNWAKEMKLNIITYGTELTEVIIQVTAGSPYRALTEAVVKCQDIVAALGTDPDSADVMSNREYRRRLSGPNMPILTDALREMADEMSEA